jgi:hypothetical protein
MAQCDRIAEIVKPYPEDFIKGTLIYNHQPSGQIPLVEMMARVPLFRYVFEHLGDLAVQRWDSIDMAILGGPQPRVH